MILFERFKNWFLGVQKARLGARRYPIYRIFERSIRIGFLTVVALVLEQLLVGSFTWQFLVGTAVLSGVDKFKNEYTKALRDYDLGKIEAWQSLFEADE